MEGKRECERWESCCIVLPELMPQVNRLADGKAGSATNVSGFLETTAQPVQSSYGNTNSKWSIRLIGTKK